MKKIIHCLVEAFKHQSAISYQIVPRQILHSRRRALFAVWLAALFAPRLRILSMLRPALLKPSFLKNPWLVLIAETNMPCTPRLFIAGETSLLPARLVDHVRAMSFHLHRYIRTVDLAA